MNTLNFKMNRHTLFKIMNFRRSLVFIIILSSSPPLLFPAIAAEYIGRDYSTLITTGSIIGADETGDPNESIDPNTGTLGLKFLDLNLPGDGPPMKILRRYRSINIESLAEWTVPMSQGWRIDYGRVRVVGSGYDSGQESSPVFEDMEGNSHPLYVDGLYGSTSPGNRLSPDRWSAVILNSYANYNPKSSLPSVVGWRITSPNGTIYDAKILSADGVGDGINYYYVHKVTDRYGRSVNIDYNYRSTGGKWEGLISRIYTSSGSTPRSFTFKYIKYNADYSRGRPLTQTWLMLSSIIGSNGEVVEYTHQNKGVFFLQNRADYFVLKTVKVRGGTETYSYQDLYTGGNLMRSRTHNNGAQINYTWSSYNPCNTCSAHKIVSVKTRRSHNVQSPGLWSYNYGIKQTIHKEKITISNVITPIRKVVYHFYSHDNPNGSLWKIGLLRRKIILTKDGKEIERTENSWNKDYINSQPYKQSHRIYKHLTKVDQDTWAPSLGSTMIRRDGIDYHTYYREYDVYGNPQKIIETGNVGKKITHVTYLNSRPMWLLGVKDTEAVDGIVGRVDRNFYPLGHGAQGNVKTLNNYGVITNYSYEHKTHNVSKIVDAKGNISAYKGYHSGISTEDVLPDGTKIKRNIAQFSNQGKILWQADGKGNRTNFFYDPWSNKLNRIAHPKGANTNISWNKRGAINIGYTVTRGSYEKVVRWDGFGRVTANTEGDIMVRYGYDAVGRKRFESFPNSPGGTLFQYDVLGRITSITRAGSAVKKYTYLANNTVKVTNENGKVSYWYYRSYGDPDKKELIKHRTPIGDTWINRNKLGMITSVQQGSQSSIANGLTRTFGYNSKYQLTSTIDPETGKTVFGRDNVGNLTSRKVRNSATTYFSYNRLNRLIKINYPDDTADVALAYDKNGQVVSVSNGITRLFSYNANQKRTSETLKVDGLTFSTSYTYDNKDTLSSMKYPSGEIITFNPDALGKALRIGEYVTGVIYHPTSEPRNLVYGNGKSLTSILNVYREIKSIFSSGVMNLTYDYDRVGNIINISDAIDGRYSQILGYDGANRLTSASGEWGSGVIKYNVYGDITQKNIGSDKKNYTYVNGKLNKLNGNSFVYDAYGNIHTNQRGDTYTFNEASQLVAANGVKYTYDGGGTLVKKESERFTTYYFYDHKKSVKLGEYDADGSTLEESFYLNDRMVAAKRYKKKDWVSIGVELPIFIKVRTSLSSPEKTYYHWNGLGSTMAATNVSGSLLWKEDYQPYGKQILGEEDDRTSVFYNSKHYDKDSGLMYLAARWYDPDMGRFISTDPVRFKETNFQSFNRYAYANNNPYRFIDPTGLEALDSKEQFANAHRFVNGVNLPAEFAARFAKSEGAKRFSNDILKGLTVLNIGEAAVRGDTKVLAKLLATEAFNKNPILGGVNLFTDAYNVGVSAVGGKNGLNDVTTILIDAHTTSYSQGTIVPLSEALVQLIFKPIDKIRLPKAKQGSTGRNARNIRKSARNK